MTGASSPRETEPFERRSERAGVTPLWTFFKEWFSREPQPRAVGHLWRYEALRPLLVDAAEVISADDAERRVLALDNPGLPGRHTVTDSLYAGLQLIVPGEIAPAHRHTAAALRFIIEGKGAYTAVSGERAYMEPGDFIVTPAWTWHEHGNEGDGPTIWLDVLDVPLIRFLGAGFSEHHPAKRYPDSRPAGDSHYRFGMNMAPAGYRRAAGASPVFSYPYARAREALAGLAAHEAPDACHGIKLEYVDPTSGGPAIPTISTFLQWLPAGFATAPYASTAGAVSIVVEGRGSVTIGDGAAARRFDFGPRDIWAVPGWQSARIEADSETVLFSASDEAVHRTLGVWRERRGEP